MSSNPEEHTLEPKYGWGFEAALVEQKEAIAQQVESLSIDYSWKPSEVIRYIARTIRES